MNEKAFSLALAFTLKEEGGFVDDPRDSGGATNHGVTQHTYDDFRFNHKLASLPVRGIMMDEVHRIYADMYWVPAECDRLFLGLACVHFDWSFNHGVSGAIKTLQAMLSVTADGDFGPKTRAALAALEPEGLVREYNTLRREWYRARVQQKPDQEKFLKGWLGRVDRLDAYVESL